MGEKPIWEQLSAFWNSLNKIILLERATEDAAAAAEGERERTLRHCNDTERWGIMDTSK